MRNLVAAILFLPLPILAAPDSTTLHFMNEPASLFDLGMHRLQAFGHRSSDYMTSLYKDGAKTDQKLTYGSGNINASYDPEDDMIYVFFSVADEQATEQQMEKGCREVLRLLRINTSKSIWRMFAHYGQERNNPNEAMVKLLYDKFELRCWVHDYQSNGRFWAALPLQGDFGGTSDMKIGKWKMSND